MKTPAAPYETTPRNKREASRGCCSLIHPHSLILGLSAANYSPKDLPQIHRDFVHGLKASLTRLSHIFPCKPFSFVFCHISIPHQLFN